MSRASRAGFTLIEMLMVVVIIGIVAAVGYPKLRNSLIKADVRSARSEAKLLFTQARATAQMTGRSTTLNFTGQQALVTATPRLTAAVGSTVDTIVGPVRLGATYGVTITASAGLTLTVDARGLASSAATNIYFTRSGVQDSIMISDFGRVLN